MDLRRLVGAVLVPHRREDAEFRDRRLAADQMQEALVLVRLQAVLGDELRGDLDVVQDHGLRLPGGPAIRVGRGIACLGSRDNIPGGRAFSPG
jgi:hypothetical protein